MMQIVLNTLQTDSADQAGSSCSSQKQTRKGVWELGPGHPPRLWAAGPAGGSQAGLATCVGGARQALHSRILNASSLFPSRALTGISLSFSVAA